ncbi:MAG: hypothetical protein OXH52_12945 [Gammaproteobacteria bacterium]|nr:hypothetical protein [Gammaproteobacteria bacterium]
MAQRKPDLLFGPGASSGFTPTGIAAFDNLRPAAVVRELVQNALDAARAARVRTARVHFELARVRRDAIPGMQRYEQTFTKAIETQRAMSNGSLARQAELVVKRIRDALDQDEVDVLTVFDNGIGLDESRMNALLSDGVSLKEGGATGTYGNGHATAIPASDLRYVLYAGVTAEGRRIGSGHAVLASHHATGEKHPRGGDGFFIRDFRAGRKGELFDYSRGPGLSGVISKTLARIKRQTGHGTAVIIPAFNNFLEDQSLWNMAAHAASANFFVAIEERRLEVTVTDHRPGAKAATRTLNRPTLSEVLAEHSENKRAAAFLSGQRAFEAHKAYRSGARHSIDTGAGRIGVRLIESASGTTRVDLCRNGMWITDRLPGFYQRFTDRVPFHAILTLNARDGRRLHDYIREAEGPLHDSISLKRLAADDQKACREALRKIRDWLLRNTAAVKSDTYVPDDFLTLDFGDDPGTGSGKPVAGYWGVPVPITRNPVRELPLFPVKSRPDHPGPPPDPAKLFNPPRHRQRPTLPARFEVASRPAGKNRQRILVESTRDFEDAELRLVMDEALDATCERHGQDAYSPAALSDVRIDGRKAAEGALRRISGSVRGVRLGDLKPGTSVRIDATYRFTGDFRDLPDPSLRVEVCKANSDGDFTAAMTTGDAK